MKINMVIITSSATFITAPLYANQQPPSVGIGVGVAQSIYLDTPSQSNFFPIVTYEGDHFFIKGDKAGYWILPSNSSSNFAIQVQYDYSRSYDPDDSDNPQMKQLDERDATFMGGVSYQLQTVYGIFKANIATDLADKHNGTSSGLSWTIPFSFQMWGMNATLGYRYDDEKINNYYYGVSATEAARTGFSAYEPDGSGSYFAGLNSYLMLTPNFSLNGSVVYMRFDHEIENSPIIEDGSALGASVGMSYRF
jgi:outer membrane protein